MVALALIGTIVAVALVAMVIFYFLEGRRLAIEARVLPLIKQYHPISLTDLEEAIQEELGYTSFTHIFCRIRQLKNEGRISYKMDCATGIIVYSPTDKEAGVWLK